MLLSSLRYWTKVNTNVVERAAATRRPLHQSRFSFRRSAVSRTHGTERCVTWPLALLWGRHSRRPSKSASTPPTPVVGSAASASGPARRSAGRRCSGRSPPAATPPRRRVMNSNEKIRAEHLHRPAFLYIQKSSLTQVRHHHERRRLQYDLQGHARVASNFAEAGVNV